VSDLTLHAEKALAGYDKRFGDTRICEVADLDIVSIATPNHQHDDLDALVKSKLGTRLPAVGKLTHSNDELMLLGLQTDQCFLVTTSTRVNPEKALKELLAEKAYLSDQSDSWAVLEITGPDSTEALARICPLDLASDAFYEDSVARTSMEHLSVIIHRSGPDGFRLYSPRSSASSFLHAVTESLYNVTTTG